MRVLNIGGANKEIPIPAHFKGWEHDLLDIDATGGADIVLDAREIWAVPTMARNYDAIYCSHNLEHYYRHDLPKVLAGFIHTLVDDGFVEIHVPDMLAVFEAIADGKDVDSIAYDSLAGPISYLDMIYGLGAMIEHSGNDFMCHKNGFTRKYLGNVLHKAGFEKIFIGENTGVLELVAYAFKAIPTPEQYQLLKLRD